MKSGEICAFVMDIVMLGIDGLEATRHIMREAPTPIVVITAGLMRAGVDLTFEALRMKDDAR